MLSVMPMGAVGRWVFGASLRLPLGLRQRVQAAGYRAGVLDVDLERPGPGKFEGNESALVSELVYGATLDGADDECGDVTENGLWAGRLLALDLPAMARQAGHGPLVAAVLARWYGPTVDAIVTEDSFGFVSIGTYADHARCTADYARTESRIMAELDAIEAEETDGLEEVEI